jgi:tellurium resistance protein TerD
MNAIFSSPYFRIAATVASIICASSIKSCSVKTVKKSLSPTWDETFHFEVFTKSVDTVDVRLEIFDFDIASKPDPMGVVTIPVSALESQPSSKEWHKVPLDSAKQASGKLRVYVKTKVYRPQVLVRGNAFPLTSPRIQVGLAWDMMGTQEVDLDVSCVAIILAGKISFPDTVYYGNLNNSNGSVVHSDDEREGDEIGDDETIGFNLDKIPKDIAAMHIILTVVTPEFRLSDVKPTHLRVLDSASRVEICSFTPSEHPTATAMFMARLARTGKKEWVLSPIEGTRSTARNFGLLVPYIKSYTKDLIPAISIDSTERLAVMGKGGNTRYDIDPSTNMDNASYALENAQDLDKHNALLVACLRRGDSGEWGLCIMSQPAQGKTWNQNIPDLQRYLQTNPPRIPASVVVQEEEVDFSEMPPFVPIKKSENRKSD